MEVGVRLGHSELSVLCTGRNLSLGAAPWDGPGNSDGPMVMHPMAVPIVPCCSLHLEPGSYSVPLLIMESGHSQREWVS